MYGARTNNTEENKKKTLLFADADTYTIPASEGWNEGYSQNNKFLYFKDGDNCTKKNDNRKFISFN